MLNLNAYLKIFLNVFLIFSTATVLYYTCQTNSSINQTVSASDVSLIRLPTRQNESEIYNVWFIFTKVYDRSPLTLKFKALLTSMLSTSSVPLHLHMFVDNGSKSIAKEKILHAMQKTNKTVLYSLYDVKEAAKKIKDIVDVMTPHFSSKPGTYYSDALFYLSLGITRIAPIKQKKAVMLDCDLYFKEDIALLFKEFENFKETHLFGLAPEQSPVYRHVLYMYRAKHNTSFGDYYHPNFTTNDTHHPKGFQGYNSGVILFNLSAIRKSKLYPQLLTNTSVTSLAKKYTFRGHLGDQDFYTLIGYEYPELIYKMRCGLNRQLCVWWRDHGYKDVFDFYFKCEERVVVLHGNCNSRIA